MSEHWINDEATRKRFWAYVKGDLGLTEDEAHEALSVTSTKDFDGDKEMALGLLRAYAKNVEDHRLVKSLTPQNQAHTEARAIAFCEVYAPDGTRINVTAREGATADTVALTAMALWDGLDILRNLGWRTNGTQRKAAQASAPVPVPQVQHEPPSAPSAGDNGSGSETFLAESITPQVSPNGNRYYSVRGGRVKKHGVTAWPEVAEPQIKAITDYDLTMLEVGQTWDVSGWEIRVLAEIPDGKEYPNKVTAFSPQGAATA